MTFYRPHNRVYAPHSDEVITKQEHIAECDINNILKQYSRTGIITHVQSARPQYTDLPSDIDYQQSLNTILEAEQAFNSLPAKVRDTFANDATRFLAAFADPKQEAMLRELGLLNPQAASPPSPPPQPATQTPPKDG